VPARGPTAKDIPPVRIAGHDFVLGRCVRPKTDNTPCGRFWSDIRPYGDEKWETYIDQLDIAHYGKATRLEMHEIHVARAAERKQVCIGSNWRYE